MYQVDGPPSVARQAAPWVMGAIGALWLLLCCSFGAAWFTTAVDTGPAGGQFRGEAERDAGVFLILVAVGSVLAPLGITLYAWRVRLRAVMWVFAGVTVASTAASVSLIAWDIATRTP
ncbi:hypothetical protein [Phytomonospora endophytica]|uniref:Uncharacterized protein n=1 Tax=Phytomonospora endophytica TaxID=714109 RepID=A0A841FMQ7_9ACTN|nr:hypothetical protein [Phytomonospora endophytica]MBB6037134.1 hypothetical protein [Phytomonospora endophytica]GIG71174.1 hypothetical protein Pen01_74690 [Phytomonospora endophytica]